MLLIGRHYNNGKWRPKVYGLCLTRLFKWPSWQTKIIRSEINHCCPRWSPLRCWLQHHSKNKSRFYRENYPQAKVSYFLFSFISLYWLFMSWAKVRLYLILSIKNMPWGILANVLFAALLDWSVLEFIVCRKRRKNIAHDIFPK